MKEERAQPFLAFDNSRNWGCSFCDGEVDEGVDAAEATWFTDADGDGFGNPNQEIRAVIGCPARATDDDRQALLDRQAHVINQTLGRCACAAVRAVQSNEIRGLLLAPFLDAKTQSIQPFVAAEHQFETHGFTGDFSDMIDQVQQVIN